MELWEGGRAWEYDRQPSCRAYGIYRQKCGGRLSVHILTSRLALLPSRRCTALSNMTLISTNTSPSIFEDGKLRPGIYKIQNIYTETFLDIEVHSRDLCCRPVGSLGEGRGIVRHRSLSGVRISDDYKWDIRRFGAGYTIQRVSFTPSTRHCHRT